jgi:hypothetical protein
MKTVHLKEYGYSLLFHQNLDISSATIIIYYTKPNGTEGTWNAIKTGDDFHYVVLEDDIDLIGTWVLWINADWTSPAKNLWARTSFKVKSAPILADIIP